MAKTKKNDPVLFEITFENGTKASHWIKLPDLRTGDHVVPTIVREQREAQGAPYQPVKSFRRMS